MILKYLTFFFILNLIGCQTSPTLVSQKMVFSPDSVDSRGLLKPNTVIFDTRSTFEFNLHRISGSISLPPQDFKVLDDPMTAARRLSLWGVTPETPAVVVGVSLSAATELAWELAQVGLKNIETYSLERLRTMNVFPEQARRNVALWSPSENFKVLNPTEIKKLSNKELGAIKNAVVLQVGNSPIPSKFSHFPKLKWVDNYLFNASYFLVTHQTFENHNLAKKRIYLVDSSGEAHLRAYVGVKSGFQNLTLIK